MENYIGSELLELHARHAGTMQVPLDDMEHKFQAQMEASCLKSNPAVQELLCKRCTAWDKIVTNIMLRST